MLIDFENKAKDTMTTNTKGVDEIDKAIGEKITLLRTTIGMTRQSLADEIGVTHQQLHKYEKAINRIPVSRIVAIAESLNTDISYFFEGVKDPVPSSDLEDQRSCLELMRGFLSIKDEEQRNAVRQLIRTLSEN